jgi:gamma-butyrobetaine dioxygenase
MAGPQPLEEIEALLRGDGARDYLGEPVSLAAHMLQAGALAEADGAPPALIAAALLHDTGHLRGRDVRVTQASGRELMAGNDNGHGARGARWLSAWFPPAVTEPVRLHVAAKRYLCAVEPGYLALLSPASARTLSAQGGPMTAAQARAFAAHPCAAGAVRVRRWDDLAKDPAVAAPDFSHFRPMLRSLLRER